MNDPANALDAHLAAIRTHLVADEFVFFDQHLAARCRRPGSDGSAWSKWITSFDVDEAVEVFRKEMRAAAARNGES